MTRLSGQLRSQADDVEKETLECLIGDIHAKIEILQIVTDPTSAKPETAIPRKSSHERRLTPKMLELKKQEASQRESKFLTLYERWKEQVQVTCTKLKDECSDQELSGMMDAVEGVEIQIRDVYENIQSQLAPPNQLRRKMDSGTAVMQDLMGLMKCMSEVGLEEFDAKAENARLHMMLDKEYAQSVFGSTLLKTIALVQAVQIN